MTHSSQHGPDLLAAAADRCDSEPDLSQPHWRKSTFSGDTGGACVECAPMTDGRIAVRNSKHPDAGVVFFTRTEMDAWIRGVKVGEFDDLG